MESVKVTDVPSDAQLVDVRSAAEWAEGHAAQAIHIPMEEIPVRYGDLDLDRDLYIMCRSGGRSAQVVDWLTRNGIDCVNVTGGIIDWEAAGLPMKTGV